MRKMSENFLFSFFIYFKIENQKSDRNQKSNLVLSNIRYQEQSKREVQEKKGSNKEVRRG